MGADATIIVKPDTSGPVVKVYINGRCVTKNLSEIAIAHGTHTPRSLTYFRGAKISGGELPILTVEKWGGCWVAPLRAKNFVGVAYNRAAAPALRSIRAANLPPGATVTKFEHGFSNDKVADSFPAPVANMFEEILRNSECNVEGVPFKSFENYLVAQQKKGAVAAVSMTFEEEHFVLNWLSFARAMGALVPDHLAGRTVRFVINAQEESYLGHLYLVKYEEKIVDGDAIPAECNQSAPADLRFGVSYTIGINQNRGPPRYVKS